MSEDRPGIRRARRTGSPRSRSRACSPRRAASSRPRPTSTARLDAVLADLVAERDGDAYRATRASPAATRRPTDTDEPRDGPVSSLARAARRRTWAPRLLVAAAVLGVAGIGFSVADDLGGGSPPARARRAGDAAGGQRGVRRRLRAGPADSGGSDRRRLRGRRRHGDGEPSRTGRRPPRRPREAMRLPAVLRITDTASLRAAVRATGTPATTPARLRRGATTGCAPGLLDSAQRPEVRLGGLRGPPGAGRAHPGDLRGQPGHARRTTCGRPAGRAGLRLRPGPAAGRGRDRSRGGIAGA